MKKFILFSIICVFILSCQATKDSSSSTESSNTEMIDGKALYTTTCVPCHGVDGKLGMNGSPDLSKPTMSLKEIIEITTNGKENAAMIGYKSMFSPKEIEAISKYVIAFQVANH